MALLTPARGAALLAALVSLGAPTGALAATRFAAPSGTATGGCTEVVPCAIDVAVNQAAAGDEVVVEPGTYAVSTPLDAPGPIDIHGVDGQPRPRLSGQAGLLSAVLTAKGGGSARHLRIDGPAGALVLQGGTGDDLLLSSPSSDAAKVVVATAGTVLRDSVAYVPGGRADVSAVKLAQAADVGSAALVNVTAVAGTGIGITCKLRSATARIADTIARGAASDVDASGSPALCSAAASNLRPAHSPGLAVGTGDQEADPLFVDASEGDLRPAAGSPTIDAGVDDPLLGTTDPAGCARRLGAAVDIGAYEYAAPGEPCGATPAETFADAGLPAPLPAPVPPAPKVGRTVVAAPAYGRVRVKAPGATHFTPLPVAARVPVGSVVDATDGHVTLTTAVDQSGTAKAGTFWGARFLVRQSRATGITTILLRGGDFSACHRTAGTSAAPVATAARKRRRVIRSLWGSDHHGRFRTHGANSVATVRGTRWLTQDRCDGTLTRVREGVVAVRDLRRHRTTLVRAGHSYLARVRG